MPSDINLSVTSSMIAKWPAVSQFRIGKFAQEFYGWSRQQGHRPMTAEVAIADKTLNDIRNLSANWDGYGALPVASSTMENARGALLSLLHEVPLPDVTPNANGTISFEWETSGLVAGLEIGATRFSFFLRPRSGSSTYADGDASLISQRGIGQIIASHLFPFGRDWVATSGCRFITPHVQAA